MNTYIQAPEIIFVGPMNHQKSAIIEAFVGHALFDVKDILLPACPCFPFQLHYSDHFVGIISFNFYFSFECALFALNLLPARWSTKRPIHFKLLSNPECAQPRVTIKRDYSSKNFTTDVRVDLKELGSELQKRNSYSQVPLVVDFEFKDCWNLTLIDAPDLVLGGAETKNPPPEDLQQRSTENDI
jgi:hypothetical protein